MLKIINKKVAPHRFIEYVDESKCFRVIDEIIFHHTSSPIDTWHGSGSMLHYWNLYRSRGWKAGPHIFIAPDGIWLFTPIKEVGRGVKNHNKGVIHIEVVGRYFDGPPTHKKINFTTAFVTDVLCRKLIIRGSSIYNHFFFDKYANETPHINAPWVVGQISHFRKEIDKIYEFNENFKDGIKSIERNQK